MDDDYIAVDYKSYCKTCKHQEKASWEDPCFECLDTPTNYGSTKPIGWEEKER